MEINWSEFKTVVDSRKLSIQWIIIQNNYWLKMIDGSFEVECIIPSDRSLSADTVDFEDNYKINGNKTLSVQPNAFASKTLSNGKSLYKRFTGISQVMSAGSNTFTWTQSAFPWVKFVGLEIINAEIGDTCDLYVLDTATGTYSGYANYTLNQFAFGANIAPNFYRHVSEYDADLYQNLQIKLVYNSVSAKTIYINFDMNEVK